jgi:hypothetical protein
LLARFKRWEFDIENCHRSLACPMVFFLIILRYCKSQTWFWQSASLDRRVSIR